MNDTALFDAMAEGYDDTFTNTQIGILQRERVYAAMHDLINGEKKLRILELNCGTGADALYFAQLGHHVVATDASLAMIEIATKKAADAGIKDHLRFVQCNFQNIDTLNDHEPFDLIISNFGGINCISYQELQHFSNAISSFVITGGSCVFVVMGTNCRWEQTYFLLKGNFSNAFRRLREKGSLATFKSFSLNVHYYRPAQLLRCFSSWQRIRLAPIGLFIPPSYLNPMFAKRKVVLRLLLWLEVIHSKCSLLSNYADHYFLQIKKAKA